MTNAAVEPEKLPPIEVGPDARDPVGGDPVGGDPVGGDPGEAMPPRSTEESVPTPRRRLPLALFLATILSTFLVGGPIYCVAVMTILTAHELGHYLQARRYGIPASLPYFIPMPITPFGTMGAIIAMRPHRAYTLALFDLAITGPLAGLALALPASVVGLALSDFAPRPEPGEALLFGTPLIFDWLASLILGPAPEGQILMIHPLAFAGWVGIFITALNLLPIGQLDGGHILFALMPERAHAASMTLMAAAIASVAAWGLWHWSLMILILLFFGLRHPPMAYGGPPLDRRRRILGWATLSFVIIGFTPEPFIL